MMLKRLGWCALFCLLMVVRVVSAQTNDISTFPVEVRCVGTPTQPPDDWTYPSMILMSGYAGIHAMQADWETPHVVAQFTMDAQGNMPIDGGQLSPDLNWYAAPMGEVYHEETFNNFWIVRGLKVYSLSGDNKTITLDLTNYPNSLSGQTAWGFSPIYWQDDRSLRIGGLIVRPFELAITDTMPSDTDEFSLIDIFTQPRVVSPDFSRAYGTYSDDTGFGWNLFDLATAIQVRTLGRLNHVSWWRDSSGFMAQMQQQDQDWHGLAYFDRDGNLIDHILQFDADPYAVDHPVSGRSELQWSPDDRYFAFVLRVYSEPNKLMLVDTQEHIVINTCLSPLNMPVWSPDGTMFSYLANAREKLNLVVVDTKTWQAYIVARHSGLRGRFGEPEMVGWRDTVD